MAEYLLGAELLYRTMSDSSHKYYQIMLAGDSVYVQYGRMYTSGNLYVKNFSSIEESAREFWKLLRNKISKGYVLTGTHVLTPPDPFTEMKVRRLFYATMQLNLNSRYVLANPPQALSPRTPQVGGRLISQLCHAPVSEELLIECALAADSEIFLRGFALQHPETTDNVRVLFALNKDLVTS